MLQPDSVKPVETIVDNAPDQANSGHYIIIPKSKYPLHDGDDVDVTRLTDIQLTGYIEFVAEKADGRYDLVVGNQRYLIRYLSAALSDEIVDKQLKQLDKLVKSNAKVTIKGVLIPDTKRKALQAVQLR